MMGSCQDDCSKYISKVVSADALLINVCGGWSFTYEGHTRLILLVVFSLVMVRNYVELNLVHQPTQPICWR